MKNKNIYVTQPMLPPLSDFIPFLEHIWESKVLTNMGAYHQELEGMLCDYLQVPYISLFNNGTNALLTALQALHLSGEVITTPFTFVATTNSIVWNKLDPVFVDIDPQTLNLDPRQIEAAITEKTTAILPVHCYGNPCDVDAIQRIADKHQLKVIYDAAHAFAVRIPEGSLLNFGDLSVLSFHATKVFNTIEGGAIVCQSKEMKAEIDLLKNFGIVDEIRGSIAPGINGKLNELQAAMGILQLQSIEETLSKREAIDKQYCEALADIPGLKVHRVAGVEKSNYSYFPIIVEPDYALSREGLYEKLKKAGIYTRRYFYPLISNLPAFANLPSACKEKLPVANQIADQILCLPIYPDLQPNQVRQIISQLRDY